MSRGQLYRDILNEGTPAEFEEDVFRKTLRTARRVRRVRIASRAALVAIIAALCLLPFRPRRDLEFVRVPQNAPEIGASHTVMQSEPFAGNIRTERLTPERLLKSNSGTVALLRTGEAEKGDLRLLSDEQLLAFFAGKAVALVRHGPRNAELIFPENEAK